ncbi:hypothetical protein MNBD_GAMMA20-1575, partial [hydrothermal vent metagenome]
MSALRDEIQEDERHTDYQEGHWKVVDRRSTWRKFGGRMFDAHLDVFKSCAIEVLGEVDPQFELAPEERYAAAVHGKILRHSKGLRKGIAQTIALLGNEGDALKNCSHGKVKGTAILIVRELFENNDWRIWASINNLLPTIAEGAPSVFLDAVQNALLCDELPLDELFKQEGGGTFGSTYLSGLLWALEGLAWSEDYLVRVATLLADLAARDPGGQWSNRPDNSLVSILLPWYPQTLAPFEKRLACLKAIRNEHPDVAWRVLVKLLPSQRQTTPGTHKSSWFLEVADDWKPTLTHAQYREQVAQYAEMAVEMASTDFNRLTDLVDYLDNLPQQAFDKVISLLSSGGIVALDEEKRLPIWSRLTRFSRKHRRYQDAQWALPLDVLERLDEVSGALAPKSPEGLYQHLFTNHDFDLYEKDGDWEEQSRLLEEKRQQAVLELWDGANLERVLAFTQIVDSPYRVGWAFANVADESAESTLLPDMLDHERTIDALLSAVSSDEPRNTLNQHHVLELIKALQEDPTTNPDTLFRVEWAYVALLDGHGDVRPKFLEKRLASDPDFFCEVIRLIYRPKGSEEPQAIDEETKAIATNAWRLLHEWKSPPGLRDDSSFASEEFIAWLDRVRELCGESGHLEVAMIKVGEVLFYCPEDLDGLWINEDVAKELNASDAGDMRDGFRTEVY